MTDFLTAVSTTTVRRTKEPETSLVEAPARKVNTLTEHVELESPEEISKALKNQPGLDTVGQILKHLAHTSHAKDGFNLVSPSPVAASIVDTLVVSIIPDYWRTFKEAKRHVKDLVTCLKNANGLGATLSRLRPLIADCRQKKPLNNARDPSAHIEDLIEVFEKILTGDSTSSQIWEGIRTHAQNPTQKKLMWREYVAQVASGRILSMVAEAEDVLKERGSSRKASWVASGVEYASWLGCNLAVLMKENIAEEESVSAVTDFCGKALGLGYLDRTVGSIVKFMIIEESTTILEKFLPTLKAYEQRKYMDAVITFAAHRYPGPMIVSKEEVAFDASPSISAIARLLHNIIKENEPMRDHVVSVLTRSSVPALDDSLATRRSLVAAIAQDDEKLHTVLENCLKTFGDSFYIKHTPLLQQEALAQTLLMVCGYVQRSQPMFMTMMAKSSYHMSGTSNRIGATSPKARFLGMVVGTAISRMVDKPDLQLKFDFEGAEEVEANWYIGLTEVDDKLGNLTDLKKKDTKKPSSRKIVEVKKKDKDASPTKPSITEITGPRIVEILDESSEEEEDDDDLMAYEKPDSDEEDDTDDATEVTRNKPTAPVYIRDLIAGLRDQEDFDRHKLALATAAPLIRRKANFGSEVSDHLEELASLLTGLHDNFDLPDFNEQRQQALIAVLLTKPAPMAQWFARAFFSGDFSIAQRTVMLTTLGLGARELAGLKDSTTEDMIPATPKFPSKQLPLNLHKIYAQQDSDPVAKITTNLAKQLLAPIAANAADKLSGPDILKVRTFSSRMAVEKQRSKPIPNALAQIVADNFFFPLTGRWWINTRGSSGDNLYTSTHLLPAFLHTLALLMHASGQNTIALPQMTREFWELLLSVRTIAAEDRGVLRALLFAFLMVLETNGDKERLATEQAKELLETQQWVRVVFEGLGAGSEEDEKVRVLAAGVLVRCQEVVDKYQRRMVGSMMDY